MSKKFRFLGRLLLLLSCLSLSQLGAYAAATPPDVSGIVDDGATVAYAAVGIAIVLTTAVVAIRSARKWLK